MAAEVPTAERTPNPVAPSRRIRMIRVAVLFVAGIAIAFSATLHEQLVFDALVTAIVIGAVGIAHLVEWYTTRPASDSATTLLLAAVAVLAAVALTFIGSAIWFAVTVAAWALASAILEFVGATTSTRRDATLLGALGILLAILVLLFRDDPVAIFGFFGAYAIIAGVFLGISAFDPARATATEESPLSATTVA